MKWVKILAKQLIWPIDKTLALLAYFGIVCYQYIISPHKGFVCAHGAITDEPSCSEYAARTFRSHTFSTSVPLVRAQFKNCRQTYANYRRDLFDSANAHLGQFESLAIVSVLACPCTGGDPEPEAPVGPLGMQIEQQSQVELLADLESSQNKKAI